MVPGNTRAREPDQPVESQEPIHVVFVAVKPHRDLLTFYRPKESIIVETD